ncbi:type II toxin-antitoxin system HigB family toxin [Komagataeibacter medellinensis]|uniref:Type II toxin-antitoxin system HigB family toxin n=2 Tax=Komagataeibacter medellinensis TaxID=1177712 RepID=A0ABQ6VYX9_9PROT|nr:type II toxin-antitoxin system HigB family toxin [Komagataeibacter medellinensis]
MQVIALKTLGAFWEKHPHAEAPLRAWYNAVSKAEWATTADIREMSRSADFVADNRVIFNIGGNKYRLIVHVSYEYKRVLIKFVGTHREYDKINPETV